ncbi:hypothetical protein ACG7TL_005672 [Trametes sanguinea]
MADTATKQSPCPGPAPFNQPSADIVLRTQDGVDFRVHTQILAQASPFFATMLSLPQPPCPQRSDADSPPDVPTSAKPAGGAAPDTMTTAPHAVPDPDSVPVVDVSEDSAPLELLLRILYPIRKPPMDDPDTLVPAIKAAHKFEMEWPVQVLSERLADVVRTPDVAIRVWASACRTGLEDVARMAALVLRQSKERTVPGSATGATESAATMPPAALACVEGLGKMEGISGGHYFRLKRFLLADQAQVDDGSLKLLTPLPKEVEPCKSTARVLFSTDIPNTDVLCRSTLCGSGEDFAVFAAHQSVLSVNSPLMKSRLTQLRSSDAKTQTASEKSKSDNKPIQPKLTFHTDPDTLATLLNVCYGHASSLPRKLDELARLVVAADTFDFQMVASRARERWSLLAGVNPLSAYLVAAHHRLRSEAQAAAKLVLKSSTLVVDRYVEVLEGSSALAYHRLLQYHDSYRELLRAKVAAAAQTLPECDIVVLCSKYRDVLKTTSIRDALQRPGVLADRLCLEWNHRQAVKDAFTESLEECMGRHRTPTIDLCKFMKAALEVVVDLPEDVKAGIDGMRLELE